MPRERRSIPENWPRPCRSLLMGGKVDYVGASAVELVGAGESAGAYREVEIKGGKFDTVTYH